MTDLCNKTYCFPEEATRNAAALRAFAAGSNVDLKAAIEKAESFAYDPTLSLFTLLPSFHGTARDEFTRCRELRSIDRIGDGGIDGTFAGRQAQKYFYDFVDDDQIPAKTGTIRLCQAIGVAARQRYQLNNPMPTATPSPRVTEVVLEPQWGRPPTDSLTYPPLRLPYDQPSPFMVWINRHAELIMWGALIVSGLALLTGLTLWLRRISPNRLLREVAGETVALTRQAEARPVPRRARVVPPARPVGQGTGPAYRAGERTVTVRLSASEVRRLEGAMAQRKLETAATVASPPPVSPAAADLTVVTGRPPDIQIELHGPDGRPNRVPWEDLPKIHGPLRDLLLVRLDRLESQLREVLDAAQRQPLEAAIEAARRDLLALERIADEAGLS